MKKIITILMAALCLVSFNVSDANAKKRVSKKKHTTTNSSESYKYQLPNMYNLTAFVSLLNKYGKKISETNNDNMVLSVYEYPFMNINGSHVTYFKNKDRKNTFVIITIESPFDNENEGFDALLNFKRSFSKKYGKPYLTDIFYDEYDNILHNNLWQLDDYRNVMSSLELNENYSPKNEDSSKAMESHRHGNANNHDNNIEEEATEEELKKSLSWIDDNIPNKPTTHKEIIDDKNEKKDSINNEKESIKEEKSVVYDIKSKYKLSFLFTGKK